MASSSNDHRAGKKYTSSHTTVTKGAAVICDIIEPLPEVTKIALGLIKTGLKTNGTFSLKIKEEPACLVLAIKGAMSVQEVRVYTTDKPTTKRAIAIRAKSKNFTVTQ
jgi:hypothetical protein